MIWLWGTLWAAACPLSVQVMGVAKNEIAKVLQARGIGPPPAGCKAVRVVVSTVGSRLEFQMIDPSHHRARRTVPNALVAALLIDAWIRSPTDFSRGDISPEETRGVVRNEQVRSRQTTSRPIGVGASTPVRSRSKTASASAQYSKGSPSPSIIDPALETTISVRTMKHRSPMKTGTLESFEAFGDRTRKGVKEDRTSPSSEPRPRIPLRPRAALAPVVHDTRKSRERGPLQFAVRAEVGLDDKARLWTGGLMEATYLVGGFAPRSAVRIAYGKPKDDGSMTARMELDVWMGLERPLTLVPEFRLTPALSVGVVHSRAWRVDRACSELDCTLIVQDGFRKSTWDFRTEAQVSGKIMVSANWDLVAIASVTWALWSPSPSSWIPPYAAQLEPELARSFALAPSPRVVLRIGFGAAWSAP